MMAIRTKWISCISDSALVLVLCLDLWPTGLV